MKPEFHDEFVELSALFFSGGISDEDWALLQVHLAYCDSCHEKFLQYKQISAGVIPAMAAILAEEHIGSLHEPEESITAAEKKLMRRLESLPAQTAKKDKRRLRWNSLPV